MPRYYYLRPVENQEAARTRRVEMCGRKEIVSVVEGKYCVEPRM